MKIRLLSLLTGAFMLASAGSASAAYIISHTILADSTNTFKLQGVNGFDAATETITSAKVTFILSGNGPGVFHGFPVPGTTYSIRLGNVPGYIIGAFDAYPFDIDIPGKILTGALLDDLNNGGDLDFDVDFGGAGAGATLAATITATVPDGGSTVALTGVSLLGIIGLKRMSVRMK